MALSGDGCDPYNLNNSSFSRVHADTSQTNCQLTSVQYLQVLQHLCPLPEAEHWQRSHFAPHFCWLYLVFRQMVAALRKCVLSSFCNPRESLWQQYLHCLRSALRGDKLLGTNWWRTSQWLTRVHHQTMALKRQCDCKKKHFFIVK